MRPTGSIDDEEGRLAHRESLRLMPPVPATLRKARVDKVVDGVFVPKGTIVYIGIVRARPLHWSVQPRLTFRTESLEFTS